MLTKYSDVEMFPGQYDRIPEETRQMLAAYVLDRVPPSHFFNALFTNNLMETCGCAGEKNMAALKDIVTWIYNKAPRDCWGSQKKVDDWLNG